VRQVTVSLIALGGADFEIIPTNNILPASPHELVASSMAGKSARESQGDAANTVISRPGRLP